MPKPESDNPNVMYTMAEAAAYCGRSLSVFRKHYRHGTLPDPMNTTKGIRKKKRLYTLAEVKMLKAMFDAMRPGRKERTRRRKHAA